MTTPEETVSADRVVAATRLTLTRISAAVNANGQLDVVALRDFHLGLPNDARGVVPAAEAMLGLLEHTAPTDVAAFATPVRAMSHAVAHWGGLPYHSAVHHAEVAMNCSALALAGRRRAGELALLLLAAFGHDYRNQPGHFWPFAQERQAGTDTVAIARKNGGLDDQAARVVRTLILSTEPSVRPAMRLGLDAWSAALLAAEPEDYLLLTEQTLALARILSDADLLCSAGLGRDLMERQTARLESEMGRPIPPSARLQFLDTIVGPSFLSEGAAQCDSALLDLRAGYQSRFAAEGMVEPDRGPMPG